MPKTEYGDEPEKGKARTTVYKIVAQALMALVARTLADAVHELFVWLAN